MKNINLSDRMPIWKIENHWMLSKAQALSATMVLGMPEAYALSEDGLEAIYNMFNRIVKAIPKVLIKEMDRVLLSCQLLTNESLMNGNLWNIVAI